MVAQLTPPEAVDAAATAVGRASDRPALAALASATVAAAIVLRHLGTKPLWRDEAISVSVAIRPVSRVLSVLPHHDANAGLYYLLLHGWLRLGGSSATWARGLSALSFVATTGLASWALGRWLGWSAGAAGGALMATNPLLVYYGQEARPYAAAVCLAVMSAVTLFWPGERPARRAYVIVTLVLLYVDLFAVLFVMAMALTVVVRHRIRAVPLPPALIRCWAVIAAVSAPLALVMAVGQRGQISWLSRPDCAVLARTVTAMSSGWIGLGLVMVLAVVAGATVGLDRAARDTKGRFGAADEPPGDRDRVMVAALAAAFVLPPVLLWTLSQAVPTFVDRYVICSAAAMVGLAAAGLDAVRKLAGAAVALALLALLVVWGGQRTARLEAGRYKVDNAPAARAFIAGQAQAGDAVGYAGGGLRIVMEASKPGPGRATEFPPDISLAPGGEAFRQHDLYARQVTPTDLAQRLTRVTRLWVVTDPNDHRYPSGGPMGQLRQLLTTTFAPTSSGSFGAIDVTLYLRRTR